MLSISRNCKSLLREERWSWSAGQTKIGDKYGKGEKVNINVNNDTSQTYFKAFSFIVSRQQINFPSLFSLETTHHIWSCRSLAASRPQNPPQQSETFNPAPDAEDQGIPKETPLVLIGETGVWTARDGDIPPSATAVCPCSTLLNGSLKEERQRKRNNKSNSGKVYLFAAPSLCLQQLPLNGPGEKERWFI